MASQDIHSLSIVIQSLSFYDRTGNLEQVGAITDLTHLQSAIIILSTTIQTGGTVTIRIEHSDDPSFTTYEEVPDEYLIGTIPIFTGIVTSAVKKVGYVGHKRYIRPTLIQQDMGVNHATAGIILLADHPSDTILFEGAI